MMDKQITQIAIYRSKVTYLQRFGLDLQHAAVHIFVDGNTEVWEYGTYNGTNGILVLRDEGKTNDESLLISCQLQTPLAYSRFVDFSKACCQGKTWGFRLTQTQTSCEFYVLQVLRQFTNSKCVALMTQKIEQNWRRAVQQSVRNQAAKSGSFEKAKSVTETYIDILLPRPY